MIQTLMSHLRYKDFLIWVHEKAFAAEVPALKTWCKCFPSYERKDATWERLASVQQLEAKIHDPSAGQDPAAERLVSVFPLLEYFSSQPDIMDPVGMELHEPDYCYVVIVQGDEIHALPAHGVKSPCCLPTTGSVLGALTTPGP